MKCGKCGEEIEVKPGKSVNFCQKCAMPIPKVNLSSDNIIKILVNQHGDGLFLEPSILLSRVEDNLRGQYPDVLKRVSLATYANVPQKIYALKSGDETKRTLGLNVILSSLMENYNEETSYGIVNLFADALGFKTLEKPNITATAPHVASQPASAVSSVPPIPASQRTSGIVSTVASGTILPFGGYEWRVLEVRENNALIITEYIIDKRRYDSRSNRWGQGCELYDWLNGEFYEEISWGNNGRIALRHNITNDNPWYPESKGSGKTIDKVFLLSLEEVCRYFGDSTAHLRQKGSTGSDWFINDGNNANRIATYNGTASWWWLRSPGYNSDYAAIVNSDGFVHVGGVDSVEFAGGVRPALWLNL